MKLSPTFDKTISLVCASVQFILHVTLTPSRSITNHSKNLKIYETLFFARKKRGENLLLDKIDGKTCSPLWEKMKKNLLLDTVEPDDTFQIWSGLPSVHSEKAIDWQDLWNIQNSTIYITHLFTSLTSFHKVQNEGSKRLLTFCWPFATTNRVKKSSRVAILTIHNQDRRSNFTLGWGMGDGGLHNKPMAVENIMSIIKT